MKPTSLIIIISIILFVGLVLFFGWRQGLNKLTLGSLFTAEFGAKQEIAAAKSDQKTGQTPNRDANKPHVSQQRVKKAPEGTAEKQYAESFQQPTDTPKGIQGLLPQVGGISTLGSGTISSVECHYSLGLQSITVELSRPKSGFVQNPATAWEAVENATVTVFFMINYKPINLSGKTDATGKFTGNWEEKGTISPLPSIIVNVPGDHGLILCNQSFSASSLLDFQLK
jgi:hypothetical protein